MGTPITLRELGRFGWNKDIPGYELPPEFFTDMENVVVVGKALSPPLGEVAVEGTPTVAPYYLFPAPAETAFYWLYLSATKAYAVQGGTHTNVTRLAGDYTGAITDKWNGGWLNGVLIVNNGVDVPQGWNPIGAGTKLVNLTNWPAATTAKVLRPFQEFMFAMDLTISGQRYKTRIRWCHPADPSTFPSSWDVTLATNLAGEYSLAETGGGIVDGLALGNSFMVYKADGIIRLDRVEGNLVFARRTVSTKVGLLAQQCVQETLPGQHVFLSRDLDIYVTNGQTIQSIAEDRVKNVLRTRMNLNEKDKCFLVYNPVDQEILVCYPEHGSSYCNRALVFNLQQNAWGHRELSPTLDIKTGVFTPNAVSRIWSSMTTTWATEASKWSTASGDTGTYKMLGAFPTETALAEVGQGTALLTGPIVTRMERRGLAIAGTDRLGNPKVNPNIVKLVQEMYPVFSEGSGGEVTITWGAQDTPTDAVAWGEEFVVNPADIDRIHPDVEGKYLAFKLESSSGSLWKFHGYTVNIQGMGNV